MLAQVSEFAKMERFLETDSRAGGFSQIYLGGSENSAENNYEEFIDFCGHGSPQLHSFRIFGAFNLSVHSGLVDPRVLCLSESVE